MSDASTDAEAMRREIERLRQAHDATERRLRATHAVSRILSEHTRVATAAPQILGALGTTFGCSLASLWSPSANELELHSAWAAEDVKLSWSDESRRHRLKPGEGLPGRVWRERGPVWIADVTTAQLPRQAALERERIRSGVGVPIVVGAEVIGVIELFSRTAQVTEDQVIDVLRTIGGHLGQFMHTARMQDELRQQLERATAAERERELERQTLAKLDELGRKVDGAHQQELIQGVTEVATELTGAQFGAFFNNHPDEAGASMVLVALAGVSRERFGNLAMPRRTPVFAPTLDGKTTVRIDDVTRDPRYGRNPPHRGIPDGHIPVKSYLAVPVTSRAGVLIGTMLFGHADPGAFTERSQLLATGLAANAATAIDNARLFGDAQRLIKALEQTNSELDQFAYVASHDLRAPLRGITNLASWIEEDLGTDVPAKIKEYVALLKGRVARMDRLIVGLMDLARIGRVRQRPERVDVTELLHETIDALSPPEATRVLIIGAMPTLVAERVALQQVFLNLIGNALVHAAREDVVVRISAIERLTEVEFSIADNGVGIAPEHHERVWQIFQTLQDVEATGVGLTLVKKQVEAHGGRAWIDAQVREGATLRFTWPKKPAR
jgi:signal transduction histidine kinase